MTAIYAIGLAYCSHCMVILPQPPDYKCPKCNRTVRFRPRHHITYKKTQYPPAEPFSPPLKQT